MTAMRCHYCRKAEGHLIVQVKTNGTGRAYHEACHERVKADVSKTNPKVVSLEKFRTQRNAEIQKPKNKD